MMGYIMELRKIVGTRPLIMAGACVLLFNEENQVLLQLRTDNHCWGLLGGSMEPGETLEETAQRELWEETGLTAHELKLYTIFSGNDFYYKYPHGDEVYNVITAYKFHRYSGVLQVDQDEVAGLRFFPLNELPAPLSPIDRAILDTFKTDIAK